MTTQLVPHAPAEVDPLHLSITQRYNSGSTHNIHMLQNPDLSVILSRGQKDGNMAEDVPCGANTNGHVVVALGVDDDHDEVHLGYLRGEIDGTEECLCQAVDALSACLDAMRRLRKA